MKKRLISLFLAMTMTFSCLVIPAYAGKGGDGPFNSTACCLYTVVPGVYGYDQVRTGTVELPASDTSLNFRYYATMGDPEEEEEFGDHPDKTPLPSGWTVDYLFTYCIVDLDSAGIPLTLPMAIPIGKEPSAWAAAVNQYIDSTYEAWSAEHPDESKSDYAIVCDYTPFLMEQENSLSFSSSGELPLKTDAELYTGGGNVYSDRYYACIARFRQGGETVYFSSVYNAETFVDFSGPGAQDYTPSVLSEPASLGDHEKSGSGNLTETLNATAVYGNKEMTYCWFTSDTGADGTFTQIYGVDTAFYDAPYPAEVNASAYYYATYSYTDDNNAPQKGRTTVAKLTRIADTNFTLKLVPDFVDYGAPAKPADFVLPQSLKSCTVTLSSAVAGFSDTITVQDFTCEKQYNLPLASDYMITVKTAAGNTIHTQYAAFTSPGIVRTIGLDNISLMDLNVYIDGNITSVCPSLDPVGLHVSAWYCDYRYTPEGEPFASGVVGEDGYVNWDGWGKEIVANGYVLCQITDEVLETEDAKLYLNADGFPHVQPYQIHAQPNAYVVSHGGTDQPVSGTAHALSNYTVRAVSTAGAPIAGVRVDFSAYGDGFTTVTADGVTDENGRCSVRMETLPDHRECTAEIVRQTTPDGFTWQSNAVSVEPGVEKAVTLYGTSASPLFGLTVKVQGADGVTLTDYSASPYADTPLSLKLNGTPVALGADGKILAEGLTLHTGDSITIEGYAQRAELDVLTGSVTTAYDIGIVPTLILSSVPVGEYSVCVRDSAGHPAKGIYVYFNCEGKTKTVLTDENGKCTARFLVDSLSRTASAYFPIQKTGDGSVWDNHNTETVTSGEERLMVTGVHFEAPLIDLTVKVMNAGGETTLYEESAYKDIPLSLTMNGKTATQSGSYYSAPGLSLRWNDSLTFEATAALGPSEMVMGTVVKTFEGPKMTAELILYPQPVVTLNCLDYAGYPHEGTPRRVLVMTNSYPQKCLYDLVTMESSVRFCVPLQRGSSYMTAFTWDTAETDWQYASSHAAQDGTHQSFPVPNENTAHTLKGGFDPLGGGGALFFGENGFRSKPVIALKSEGLWSVVAQATVCHSTSTTTENLKDVFVLPEGAAEITVTQSGEPAILTVDNANRTVTVSYEEAPRTHTFITIYFDIPENRLDAEHSCTMESYVEYDYRGEHYSAALNSSVARADELSISGRASVSLNDLTENDYMLTVRLPAEGSWDVTVFDDGTEVGSITGLKSKNNFSVPLAAVTGAHEIRCEMTNGSFTETRTMTVSVLPDTRPVLQKLYVNGTDMTDGAVPLTYDARNSRFDAWATYTHPEQIEKLWLVAETTAENYYLELTWDERTNSFKGNGVLGSLHEPVYSVWLSMVEKWDPDTVMDYVTYDDSLFTDVLYFNETNLVPTSEDPLQEQALADWELYTELINKYQDSTDKEAILAAVHELFGDDDVWYTPAIYLADGSVWQQEFHFDPAAVEAALSSPDAITVNINGIDVKSAVTVDPDTETVTFMGCADSMLPPVLTIKDLRSLLEPLIPTNPSKIVDFASFLSVGVKVKGAYDAGKGAAGVFPVWDQPLNNDNARKWMDGLGSIPGAPPGIGAVGGHILGAIGKRQDDAKRAAKGLPPRGGPGGPGGGGGPTAPLIDPSGYIYEAVESNRIEGVSASLYYKDGGGSWVAWDSEAYGQSANPMLSLEGGIYGWDVLPGTWKVVFEKDGYITAESEELPVPPPHLDVNISLVSEAAPQVQSVTISDDGSAVTLTFDRYMKVSELTAPGAVSFTVGGAPLTGTLTAVNVEAVRTGNKQAVGNAGLTADEQAATKFTFTPTEPVAPGTAVSVSVPTSVHAYNGKTLAAAYSTSVTVPGSSQSGGGGGVNAYAITGTETENGKLTLSSKSASSGQTVTITVTPDKGFTLETLTVLDKDGKELEVKNLGDGKYSFTMPGGKVTVKATFMEDNTMLNFFVDVPADAYYYDAVLWAAKNGITKGVDDTHFSPNASVTRGQVVTFLWRAAGCPVVDYYMNMSDVKSGEYYAEAVRWALREGVTMGTSDMTFSPDAVCTRGQIVTFLARFAGVKDADTASVFNDVKSSDYFAAAVKWAKDNGVTSGTSATTFSPSANCTRAQVVTFLYRWMVK